MTSSCDSKQMVSNVPMDSTYQNLFVEYTNQYRNIVAGGQTEKPPAVRMGSVVSAPSKHPN